MIIKEHSGPIERADLIKVLLAKTTIEEYYDHEIFDLIRDFNQEYLLPFKEKIQNSKEESSLFLCKELECGENYHLTQLFRHFVEDNEDKYFALGVDLILILNNKEPIFHEIIE